MKPLCFLLFTFYFLLAVACRPAAAPVSISNKPVSINNIPQTNLPMPPSKPLGEMSWTDVEGKTQKLGELKGKVVVLDFWATNCPPCLEEIPHLVSLQSKYGADNLQIFGLHVGDEEDAKRIPTFAEKLKISYTLAFPEQAWLGFMFAESDAIPQTAIFDRDGKLVQKFIGFNADVKTNLDKIIEQTINEK